MGKEADVEARWPGRGSAAGRLQYEPPKLIFRGLERRVFSGARTALSGQAAPRPSVINDPKVAGCRARPIAPGPCADARKQPGCGRGAAPGLHPMAAACRQASHGRSTARLPRGRDARRELIQTFVDAILLTVASLLPIMNPFSTAPLFVSLTASFEPRRRHSQAVKACLYAFAILVVFLLAGAAIVDFFGISIPGIRAAGGLIILAIGFRMLFPPAAPQSAEAVGAAPDLDVAFSPLAMPSLAGPGSIAVVMSAAAQIRSERPNDWVLIYAAVIAGMAATLVFSYLVLRLAGVMVRFMGPAGIDSMTRIFGFLLVCIGMQFLLGGIADFYGLHVGAAPAGRT